VLPEFELVCNSKINKINTTTVIAKTVARRLRRRRAEARKVVTG
jgi:hypothetical protein